MWLERFQESKSFDKEEIQKYWCTSYALQRSYEGSGYKYKMFEYCDIGGFPNAKNWYAQTILPKTDKANVGCIACWSGGEYGHVAYVEDHEGNHIKVSQANSQKTFYITEHDVEVGKINTELGSDYVFLGFIQTPINDIRTVRDTSKNQIRVFADMLRVRESPNGNNVTGLACPKGIYDCEIVEVDGVKWAKLEDTSYIMTNDGWTEIYPKADTKEDLKGLVTMSEELVELSSKIKEKVAQIEENYAQNESTIDSLNEELKILNEKLESIRNIL